MIDDKKMSNIDESDVKKYFDGYGTIETIDIPRDHVTMRPKGYILIEFARQSEAKDAVHLLDGFEIDGKKIKVDIFTDHLQKELNAIESKRQAEGLDGDSSALIHSSHARTALM